MLAKCKKVSQGLLVAFSCWFSQPGLGAVGDVELSHSPLIVTDAVEPNIYLIMDSSGSMESDIITDYYRVDTFGDSLPSPQGTPYFYMFPLVTNGREFEYGWIYQDYGIQINLRTVPSTAAFPLAWAVRNHRGNTLYYNPEFTYSPWPGLDASGNPLYKDVDPFNAPEDPLNPGFSSIDLTQDITYVAFYNSNWYWDTLYPATYNRWIDDGDGVFEVEDSFEIVDIKPSSGPFESGRTYREELQNFANWFTYYRKRSLTAKSVLGRLVNNNSTVRIAFRVLETSELIAADTMTSNVNKSKVLEAIYDHPAPCFPGLGGHYPNKCGGTPLLETLQSVGKQFANPSTTPIVSQTKGGECQQNFSIMMTDGFWNDIPIYLRGITNADNDSDTASASKFDGNASESNDGGNYSDSYSPTLADVAMYYYETDLSTLADRVPEIEGTDLATHQHLVTFTIAFGVKGTFDLETVDPTAEGFAWTDPLTGTVNETAGPRIDDLYHAAYNSRALHLSAGSPLELEEAMDEAFGNIADRTATAAAVSINSAKLTTESVVYIAQFNTNRWQGNLYAYKILDTDTGELSGNSQWDAASILNKRDLETDPRVIFTHDGRTGVPFLWDSLSRTQQADFKVDSLGNTQTDVEGEARLDYIRGDRSNEGQGISLRERASIMGDIVNSGPVYVGKPSLRWPDSTPFPTGSSQYSNYKESQKNRRGVVYVGSNDGMLHGFDESSGREVISYIPSSVYSSNVGEGLHTFSEVDYSHRYYVDLTPTISDVHINTGGGTLNWETILLGGLRSGGKGLFALKVTNPDKFVSDEAYNSSALAQDTVLWEFTDAHDSDLGFTHSQPQVALANNGRWVAIVGNGYNSTNGDAALFVLDIEKGIDGWVLNDYEKISTGVGSSTDKNGLNTPAIVDIDGNGTVDRVYAGDLKGNLWAFDLSSNSEANWGIAYGRGTNEPLFVTKDQKPITAKPVVAKHPTQPDSASPSNSPNLMVFVGTGQYLGDGDKYLTDTDHFFGVWDSGTGNLDYTDLIEQTFLSGFNDSNGNSARVLSRNDVDYTRDYGWYFELPDRGERSVTAPVARANVVFFNSFVPVVDPCQIGGYGYRFAVDMATGGSPEDPAIDEDEDGIINEDDKVSDGSDEESIAAVKQDGYLPEPVFIEDVSFTGATPSKVEALRHVPTGRFSWQELIE